MYEERRHIIIGVAVLLVICLLLSLFAAIAYFSLDDSGEAAALPAGLDPNTDGVLIMRVAPNSPAEEVGLHRGTIIFAVDGIQTNDQEALRVVLEAAPAGSEVTLYILRGGEVAELPVTLSSTPPLLGVVVSGAGAPPGNGPPPEPPANAEPQSTLPPAAGELPVVTRVIVNSPADLAGFQTGDVIVEINTVPIASIQEAITQIGQLSPGESIPFVVQRAGLAETLIVVLGERAGSEGEPFLGVQLPPVTAP